MCNNAESQSQHADMLNGEGASKKLSRVTLAMFTRPKENNYIYRKWPKQLYEAESYFLTLHRNDCKQTGALCQFHWLWMFCPLFYTIQASTVQILPSGLQEVKTCLSSCDELIYLGFLFLFTRLQVERKRDWEMTPIWMQTPWPQAGNIGRPWILFQRNCIGDFNSGAQCCFIF